MALGDSYAHWSLKTTNVEKLLQAEEKRGILQEYCRIENWCGHIQKFLFS